MRNMIACLAAALLGCGAAAAQGLDTLAKAKASGKVVIGVREASGALSVGLGGGRYAGYHVELCQRIVANLEKSVGRPLAIEYRSLTSQTRIPLVQSGSVDLDCGSTSNTTARQRDVAFSLTTYVEEVRVAVRASSGIRTLAELNGKVVATTASTTSVQLLRRHARENGLNFKELIGRDHADGFAMLETGHAEAFVMDLQILAGHIGNSPHRHAYRLLDEVLSVEPIAIMLRKQDVALKRVADATIRDLIASGELAAIYERWFMKPIPPRGVSIGVPLSAATREAWARPNDKPVGLDR